MQGSMRNKRHKKRHMEELNIIPLIDITANLLFFLMVGLDLKEQAEQSEKIELPASTSKNQEETPMVKLSLSTEQLICEGIKQAKLKDGKFQSSDLKDGLIKKLQQELEKKRKAIEASGIDLSVEKNKPVVHLMAERGLNYETVEMVMRTAGSAGFPRFRFAVTAR